MTKLKVDYPERSLDISVSNVEIVVDPNKSGRVEIWMLDEKGNRVEGGDFDLGSFMDVVLDFYNKEF